MRHIPDIPRNGFDVLDAFIYEHGFTLYMGFVFFSLITFGVILARQIRVHSFPPVEDRQARRSDLPPILGSREDPAGPQQTR